MFGSKELAYAITMHDYELFMSINQVEILDYVTMRFFSFSSMNCCIKSLVDINTAKSRLIWIHSCEDLIKFNIGLSQKYVSHQVQENVYSFWENSLNLHLSKTSSLPTCRPTNSPLDRSCKEFRNLNAFFAIVMGLSNIAVSRLSLTWEVRINNPSA